MPNDSITAEKGPKGIRGVIRLYWVGVRPYVRARTWRSSWFNTGNEQRDFYLARMELQRRVADAVASRAIPK